MGNLFSKIKKYLKEKNRIILQNPRSYEQKFALTISKGNTILFGIAITILFSFIVYLVISFTSIKNLIPGYPSKGSELYQIDQENQAVINKMFNKNRERELWINNLQAILNNSDSLELSDISDTLAKDSTFDYKKVVFQRVKEDSSLRKKASLYNLRDKNSILYSILTEVFYFEFPSESNFESVINNEVNQAVFYPKYKSKIRASISGTAIITSERTVVLQHTNSMISVYDNFDNSETKVGDKITRGKVLGVARDSVFNFQLWYHGESISTEILNELR